jgi:hypothetical protein
MAIGERVIVNVRDGNRPPVIPTLSEVLLIDTTAGKSFRNQFLSFAETDEALEKGYDVTDTGYAAIQTFFRQNQRVPIMRAVNIARSEWRKALRKVGTANDDNEITITSEPHGAAGTNISIAFLAAEADQELSVSVTKSLIVGVVNDHNALTYVSKRAAKEVVQIKYDTATKGQNLSVDVTNDRGINQTTHTITVFPEVDIGGVVQSTALEVLTELTEGAKAKAVKALVTVDHTAGSDGSGVVTSVAATKIPVDITVLLATDELADVTSTATNVVNAVNLDTDAADAVTASLTGTGNDGSGIAVAASNAALSASTTASPAELSRALAGIIAYQRRQGLPEPYMIVCTSHDDVDGDRKELSDSTSTRRAFYLTSTKEEETPEEIRALTVSMISDRSRVIAHRTQFDQYPEMAEAAIWASVSPGGITLAYQELEGFTESGYDTSEIAIIEGSAPGGSGGNVIEEAFGIPMTTGSWTTKGTFADQRRNRDWLILWLTLVTIMLWHREDIVHFDIRGTAKLKAEWEKVCKVATNLGIIAVKDNGEPDFEVIMPSPLDVHPLNRARRTLRDPGGKIELREAGAIERVTIDVFARA